MNATILLFLGFVFVFVVYYLWKVRLGPELDYSTSVSVPRNVGEQKRIHPRAKINWPVSMEASDGTVNREINNISLGGAFICCEKPLPIRETFHPTMTGPDQEPVAATAEVVWLNVHFPDAKVIHRGMGVRFIKMSDRHIRLVRQVFKESE